MLNNVSSLKHVICRAKSQGSITHKLFHVKDKSLKIKICLSSENMLLPSASNLTHQIRIQVPKQSLDLRSEQKKITYKLKIIYKLYIVGFLNTDLSA